MNVESSTLEELVVAGVPMRVARPAGPVETGVVVLHQAPGYLPHIAEWLALLADHGHLAVAPLLLHHRGEVAVDPFAKFGGDLAAFAAFLPGDEEIRGDISAALDLLQEEGVAPKHTAIVGFSYGGRAAFLAATERSIGAAVTFYGNGIQNDGYPGNDGLPPLTNRAAHLRAPWLGLYGEQDFLLAPGELDEFESALRSASGLAELVRYPNAGHAFDADMTLAPGGPSTLDPDAATEATRRTLDFLRSRLSAASAMAPDEGEPT